jgi:nucleoside-diphosphate-sugar epimerase
MRVFLTGATGFIGRALSLRLVGAGHQVTAWVRDETRARALIGPDIALASTRGGSNIRSEIEGADAVVNLAGEPDEQPFLQPRPADIGGPVRQLDHSSQLAIYRIPGSPISGRICSLD